MKVPPRLHENRELPTAVRILAALNFLGEANARQLCDELSDLKWKTVQMSVYRLRDRGRIIEKPSGKKTYRWNPAIYQTRNRFAPSDEARIAFAQLRLLQEMPRPKIHGNSPRHKQPRARAA
jgi:hypothetical protein